MGIAFMECPHTWQGPRGRGQPTRRHLWSWVALVIWVMPIARTHQEG